MGKDWNVVGKEPNGEGKRTLRQLMCFIIALLIVGGLFVFNNFLVDQYHKNIWEYFKERAVNFKVSKENIVVEKVETPKEKFKDGESYAIVEKDIEPSKGNELTPYIEFFKMDCYDENDSLTLRLNNYSTEPYLSYEIALESDGENISDGNVELIGGFITEIGIEKVEKDALIDVILYQVISGYDKDEIKVISRDVKKLDTFTIDLSKDLEEIVEIKHDKKEVSFQDLSFEIYDNAEEYSTVYEDAINSEKDTNFYDFNIIEQIGNKEEGRGYFEFYAYKNLRNITDIDELYKARVEADKCGESIADEYHILIVDNSSIDEDGYGGGEIIDEIDLTLEEYRSLLKDKKIKVGEKEYTIDQTNIYDREYQDVKKIKIDGIDAVTYKCADDTYCMFANRGYIYTIRMLDFGTEKTDFMDFIKTIKIEKEGM